jgi:hypothetical protein
VPEDGGRNRFAPVESTFRIGCAGRVEAESQPGAGFCAGRREITDSALNRPTSATEADIGHLPGLF